VPSVSGPRVRAQPRIERFESFEAAREEWSVLAGRSRNVFCTWEWASTWWREFGAGRPLHLLGVRDSEDSRLRAILPLYAFTGRPLRILRFIGHGVADELGPVCAPEDRQMAARALRDVATRLRAELLLAERLPADHDWNSELGGEVLKHEASPVLDLDATSWEQLTEGWSANTRQQLRRKERKLAREHKVHFRLVEAPEVLPSHLETLFGLHAARWGAAGNSFVGAHTAFHHEFAHAASERGWLRLWLLEVDDHAVAAMLIFRFGDVDCYYQSGRDPDWDKASVGTVLMCRVMRSALEDGMHEYRMLRGAEPYKYRFATRDPGVESRVVACRPLGKAALAAHRVLPDALVSPLRQWVNR